MSAPQAGDPFDPQSLAIDVADTRLLRQPRPRRRQRRGLFVKGPIPLSWIHAAAKISGNVSRLAWVIWFLAGLKRTTTFKLNLSKLGPFGLNRFSASRALVTLEHSRLVSVDRRHGRNPIITILEMEGPAYGAVN
jgi:hypothetical protein